jgi:hypothetical protein
MKRVAIACVVLVILGALIGFYFAPQLKFPRGDHEYVAKQVIVYDKTYGRTQTLVFVESGQGQMLSLVPMQFTPQTVTYKYSFWVFKSGNDVNAVMWIWGPGDDGKTYNVEVARLAGNELEITYPGGKKTFPANSDEGYLAFTVTAAS